MQQGGSEVQRGGVKTHVACELGESREFEAEGDGACGV